MKAESISTVSENLLMFLFLTTKKIFRDPFIDFISLSDDLKKSRAWSPDQDSCIAEAQFIFSALQLRQT